MHGIIKIETSANLKLKMKDNNQWEAAVSPHWMPGLS